MIAPKAAPDAFLPYGRQSIDEDDISAVTSILRGSYLTCGPMVEKFEHAIAEYTGARYAVACSSGTAALHLATLALGLKSGDISIVPTVTFLATANASRYVGADVIFSDVEDSSGLMTAENLKWTLDSIDTNQAKAVFPVHLNGQATPIEEISATANDLFIVEDAAHALGTIYTDSSGKQVNVGSCANSDCCIFSFHPVKTITMGEGGVVTTNDETLYKRLQRFRHHGVVRDADNFALKNLAISESGTTNPWHYEMPELGYNYRASDIHCALGLSQLKKLERFVTQRLELVKYYDQSFNDCAPTINILKKYPGQRSSWHLYPIFIDFVGIEKDRAQVMEELLSYGIGTQVHYIPVHLQPYYHPSYTDGSFPGAMTYFGHVLSLPLFPEMTMNDVDRVVDAVRMIVPIT
jgi:UDP-4-amino-4,6-dideoxy-N-acetyl-beta-L-altrosamine transaminase